MATSVPSPESSDRFRDPGQRYRTLLEINNAMISSLTRDALFRAIATAVGREVSFARTAIFLHDHARDVLRLFVLESSLPSSYFDVGLEIPAASSHVGWVFQRQQPLLRRDLERERVFAAEDQAFADGVRAYVIVPITTRGRPIGTFAVASTRPGQYDAADVAFPQEVANQAGLAIENMVACSGVVGRHYMGRVNSVLMAFSKCPNPTELQKTLGLNDFYFGSEDWPYPMGHISFVGKLDGVTLEAGAPAIAPGWTLDLMARHSLDFWLTSEDLPDPDNRVTLDRQGGIVLSYRPNNEEAHQRLTAKLEGAMQAQTKCAMHGHECHQGLFARNLFIGQRIPLAGVTHQNGTIRFGHDPRTSALDVDCKAHDLDNLYVVDASFFPSSAAVNPALTVIANALRVGDHLTARLR